MKKLVGIMFFICFAISCTNNKVDENKLNEAGDKLQKTVEKGADSIGLKLKRLKKKIDSTHNDTLH